MGRNRPFREPAFSGDTLFISGTASIVGHETVHVGDVTAQTRETLDQHRSAVGEANRVSGAGRFSTQHSAYKVYVRHARRPAAHPIPTSHCTGRKVLYLQADVCRQDLLVEIEAVGRAR